MSEYSEENVRSAEEWRHRRLLNIEVNEEVDIFARKQ